MPQKHRKSGTFDRKVPLRCYKDTSFFSQKQIVLKRRFTATGKESERGFFVKNKSYIVKAIKKL